jgi:acyl dehydratase
MASSETARHRVVAHNYATSSENRIHGDEVARRYGFSGGLVPGVATYAYLTRPVLDLLGDGWLGAGEITVKLVHPVYDGDTVEATARRSGTQPAALELELRDSSGRVCAMGLAAATGPDGAAAVEPLPFCAPPPLEARPLASLEELRPGRPLVTLDLFDALRREGCAVTPAELRAHLADRYRDPDPRFLDYAGPLHPALVPELANQVLARSVRLGPWIHARSHTRHYAPLHPEGLQARGRVEAAYSRNGNETVELDVRLYGPAESGGVRLLARVAHRAIVRPRVVVAE